MNIRHEQFVESLRRIINKDDSTSRLLSQKPEDESDLDSFELQKELERRFNEIFGPLDDDD